MNKFIHQSNKILSFALIGILLQACSNLPQSEVNQSLTTQQNIEFLLQQIKTAAPHTKNPLLVQAAGMLILEQKFEKAHELLIRVNQQLLSPLQMEDFHLFYAESLLELDANEKALSQLLTISSLKAKDISWQIRYTKSLSKAYLAVGNYFESAKLRIEMEDVLESNEALAENNEQIWFILNQLESNFLRELITGFNDKRLNGWLEIVFINKRWGYHPKQLLNELELWKKRYPLHPSLINQPASIQKASSAETLSPKRIAVLLPLTGKHSQIATIISDGILAAHYQSKETSEPTLISFYDTADTLSAITPYQQAVNDGADFILGPLTKESIESITKLEQLTVPMLALNRLDDQDYVNPQIYQFGLSPEDEAIQAAHRAFDKGFRKAIALIPEGSLGQRVEEAFRSYFEELGGELIDVQKYKDAKFLNDNVQHLLGVDKSKQRKRSLQQLLGRNLVFEERRRQDADFIFMMATPTMGRSIKPFIDFYYAHDLPKMATSLIYSGKHDPKTDIDLNGIEFPDIPLLLSELPEFKDTRIKLSKSQPDLRLFGLGFDSYNMISELALLRAFPDYRWHGLTGELGIDEQGIVHRYLTWAQFNRGVPKIIQELDVKKIPNKALINVQAPLIIVPTSRP